MKKGPLCNKCKKTLKTPTCKIQDGDKRKWESFQGIQICTGCNMIVISGNSVKDIILLAKKNQKKSIPLMRVYQKNDKNGITLLQEKSS